MKLYHGTDMVFDKIDLCKSKPNKDFGQGFYLSPDYDQALNMAKIKTEQQQAGEPVVMEFDVEEGYASGKPRHRILISLPDLCVKSIEL